MKQFTYTVRDPLGIHARPAGILAMQAKTFSDTVITVTRGGTAVRATQLMKLMSLGVRCGDVLTVSAEGPSEDAAIAVMQKCFAEIL